MARILLIDDDASVRSSIRRSLERGGHDVLDAGDAREGVEVFQDGNVDLVITDLVLPDQRGAVLIDRIREMDGDVPIIAISGEIEPAGPLHDAMLMGANMRIGKPFGVQDLLAAVAVLLTEEA